MSLLTDLSERWRALVHRRRADQELDEELAFHVEHEIAKRMSEGMEAGEARRTALAALGGVQRLRDSVHDARGVRPFEDLTSDLRLALRWLTANPLFSLTVVVVLGAAL